MHPKIDSVLVIEDDPETLPWLEDFFENKNLKVQSATNLSEALELISKNKYLIAIVDMNIPAPGSSGSLLVEPISKKYPGYIAAHELRNKGYGAHQVIAYTVHDDDELDAALAKINCRYVLKGRPNILKNVIEKSLAPKR